MSVLQFASKSWRVIPMIRCGNLVGTMVKNVAVISSHIHFILAGSLDD